MQGVDTLAHAKSLGRCGAFSGRVGTGEINRVTLLPHTAKYGRIKFCLPLPKAILKHSHQCSRDFRLVNWAQTSYPAVRNLTELGLELEEDGSLFNRRFLIYTHRQHLLGYFPGYICEGQGWGITTCRRARAVWQKPLHLTPKAVAYTHSDLLWATWRYAEDTRQSVPFLVLAGGGE